MNPHYMIKLLYIFISDVIKFITSRFVFYDLRVVEK